VVLRKIYKFYWEGLYRPTLCDQLPP
jgi:hypothetical protein